jgi:hypothetical protein
MTMLRHETEMTLLVARARGLNERAAVEQALHQLVIRARGPAPSLVAAGPELERQALLGSAAFARREQAMLASWGARANRRYPDERTLATHNEAVWERLWREYHLERGLQASAIPSAPPVNRLASLGAAGEIRCEPRDGGGATCAICANEAITAGGKADALAKAKGALRAAMGPIPPEDVPDVPKGVLASQTPTERLARALYDVIDDAVLQASPEPSTPADPFVFTIEKLVLGNDEPTPKPPAIQVRPPDVFVQPPKVVVNVERPGPRSIHVEEDEDGNRVYRVSEEEG